MKSRWALLYAVAPLIEFMTTAISRMSPPAQPSASWAGIQEPWLVRAKPLPVRYASSVIVTTMVAVTPVTVGSSSARSTQLQRFQQRVVAPLSRRSGILHSVAFGLRRGQRVEMGQQQFGELGRRVELAVRRPVRADPQREVAPPVPFLGVGQRAVGIEVGVDSAAEPSQQVRVELLGVANEIVLDLGGVLRAHRVGQLLDDVDDDPGLLR